MCGGGGGGGGGGVCTFVCFLMHACVCVCFCVFTCSLCVCVCVCVCVHFHVLFMHSVCMLYVCALTVMYVYFCMICVCVCILRYPSKEWLPAGTFEMTPQKVPQTFTLTIKSPYVKFLRVDLIDHYGTEHFCPITLFRYVGCRPGSSLLPL